MPRKDPEARRKYDHEYYKRKHPNAVEKGAHHNQSDNPAYRSWTSMKMRCNWKGWSKHKFWGGRGIKYDPRWEKFENFLVDMGERPEGTSLDRIDNDKDYSKENCRWATAVEQNRNRSYCVNY
jgi:hypothetical protein